MVYLDNAATTALTPSVISAMTNLMAENFGNPSSLHSYGRQASQTLRKARQTIANCLNIPANHLVFTSGGTESNNMAIKGYALANQDKGKHIITTAIEHHSVLDVMEYLTERFGFEVTYLYPENGTISPKQVKQALREDTILVSTMYANNETGHILPVRDIAELLTDHQAVYHIDGVQVAGKLPINLDELGCDFFSLSAHKFHGPKGVGLLYAKPHKMDNLLHGGDQEDKRRASTENLIGIVGMAQALSDVTAEQEKNFKHVLDLRQHLLTELEHSPLNWYSNSPSDGLPHVLNIGFTGANNELLLTQLDLAGFALSSGSACTAGAIEPSHVLKAFYGEKSPCLRESIRISLSEFTSPEELTQLVQTFTNFLSKGE
ncbi:cysteine desulfurase family protein [Streptococcus caprae]|uniref:cysteine desulfurase n=1 Tax=Streptococcus caprae TaxID=1640501 RepID=A0ABV8CY03_9STRE